MPLLGQIRRRLTLAIVLTALIPVLVAIGLVESTVRQTSSRFFVPEIGERLDESLGLYQELARAIKARMRSEASAIAAQAELRNAVRARDAARVADLLESALDSHPSLVSLEVVEESGRILAAKDRGHPVDPKTEKQLTVRRPLAGPSVPEPPLLDATSETDSPSPSRSKRSTPAGGTEAAESELEALEGLLEEGDPEGSEQLASTVTLVAVFATDRARFDQLAEMGQFVNTYRKIEQRRESDEQSYVFAFATLLGFTILAAVGVGVLLARGVSRRIAELARATNRVGAGDLSVRVSEEGSDEIADFSRAFNRMLAEVESSRARIEYLQRIGAWQEMARRLAHEIKNPLTPIQLAAQEIERRYSGDNPEFSRLLSDTREIVEDEVATLRRLVSEFSGFARMPRAELARGDLSELLRRRGNRIRLGTDDPEASPGESLTSLGSEVNFELDVPQGEALAQVDPQLLGRVLTNLIRNASQALAGDPIEGSPGVPRGRIALRLHRDGDYWVVDVDDDGPGIEPAMRQTAFDPYVTSKSEGTGLGLAIVKKIIVEHGGSIEALESPWGGARIRIRLPVLGTPASEAALDASRYEAPASTRSPFEQRPLNPVESSRLHDVSHG